MRNSKAYITYINSQSFNSSPIMYENVYMINVDTVTNINHKKKELYILNRDLKELRLVNFIFKKYLENSGIVLEDIELRCINFILKWCLENSRALLEK